MVHKIEGPGLLRVSPGRRESFGMADALEDHHICDVVHSSSALRGMVLDCEGINVVDSPDLPRRGRQRRLSSAPTL